MILMMFLFRTRQRFCFRLSSKAAASEQRMGCKQEAAGRSERRKGGEGKQKLERKGTLEAQRNCRSNCRCSVCAAGGSAAAGLRLPPNKLRSSTMSAEETDPHFRYSAYLRSHSMPAAQDEVKVQLLLRGAGRIRKAILCTVRRLVKPRICERCVKSTDNHGTVFIKDLLRLWSCGLAVLAPIARTAR